MTIGRGGPACALAGMLLRGKTASVISREPSPRAYKPKYDFAILIGSTFFDCKQC
jgi:hypothetical protein